MKLVRNEDAPSVRGDHNEGVERAKFGELCKLVSKSQEADITLLVERFASLDRTALEKYLLLTGWNGIELSDTDLLKMVRVVMLQPPFGPFDISDLSDEYVDLKQTIIDLQLDLHGFDGVDSIDLKQGIFEARMMFVYRMMEHGYDIALEEGRREFINQIAKWLCASGQVVPSKVMLVLNQEDRAAIESLNSGEEFRRNEESIERMVKIFSKQYGIAEEAVKAQKGDLLDNGIHPRLADKIVDDQLHAMASDTSSSFFNLGAAEEKTNRVICDIVERYTDPRDFYNKVIAGEAARMLVKD